MTKLIVPITCPLEAGNSIDISSLEKHLAYLGNLPLFVNGEMGEHLALGQGQRKAMMRYVSEARDGDVLIGVTGRFWHETKDLLEYSRNVPGRGVVLRPGAILHVYREDLGEMLDAAHALSQKSVYLYYNEKKDAQLLTPAIVSSLSQLPYLEGIKITAGTGTTEGFLDMPTRGSFMIYIGNPDVMIGLDSRYIQKAHGAVIGTANALPKEWSCVIERRESRHSDISSIMEFDALRAKYGVSVLGAVKNYLASIGVYSSARCMNEEMMPGDSEGFRQAVLEKLIRR